MNRRLPVLLRQREMLREHLEWLEGEIAAEGNVPGPAAGPADLASGGEAPTTGPAMECFVPEPDIKGLHGEVRRGCLGYFVVAALGISALIGYIYWRY